MLLEATAPDARRADYATAIIDGNCLSSQPHPRADSATNGLANSMVWTPRSLCSGAPPQAVGRRG